MKYNKYTVAQVLEVEAMKDPLKKVSIQISADEEDTLTVVTNAKHISEGDIVIVALEGALVPAGSEPEEDGGQGIKVGKTSVGGAMSNGMLCDGVMLNW